MKSKALCFVLLAGVAGGCGSTVIRNTHSSPAAAAALTAGVPERARLVASGVPPLSAVIGSPGTLYLINDSSRSMPHSADFSAMENMSPLVLALDPERKALVVRENPEADKVVVLVAPLDMANRYSMWFVPAARPAGAGAGEEHAHEGAHAPAEHAVAAPTTTTTAPADQH